MNSLQSSLKTPAYRLFKFMILQMRYFQSILLSFAAIAAPLFTHAASLEDASKYLDHDGSLVAFMDFEGDGKEIGDALNLIYQEVVANSPQMPPIPLDFNQLIENLGYGSLSSFAVSSKEVEPGLHRNRSVALLKGELSGLLKMYGTKAHTFTAAEQAPADASGAITATMDLNVIRDTIISIMQQVMGPMGEGLAQQQLEQPIPGTDIKVNEVIEALSGKWDAFWLQSYGEDFQQTFKFWISIEQGGVLFTRLQPLAESLPITISENETSRKADLSLLIGEDAPFGLFIKAIKESGDLIIYSHEDWNAHSEGPRLIEKAEFMSLAKRLPSEGLAFSYSVGADIKPIFAALDALPEVAQYSKAIQSTVNLLFGDYMKPNIAVTTLHKDAIVTEQYAGYSTKQIVLALPVMVGGGLTAAMAIPAFQKVRASSQEKAVTNNLRQIASAADQYFLEEGKTSVTIEELVGPDKYIRELIPVAGESYEGMIITMEMDEISVTLESGQVVSLPF
ncbi:MAG: hypothetical protein ACSHX4_00830 [Opitutaceae bacterium]